MINSKLISTSSFIDSESIARRKSLLFRNSLYFNTHALRSYGRAPAKRAGAGYPVDSPTSVASRDGCFTAWPIVLV